MHVMHEHLTKTRGVRAHVARTPKNRTITRGVRAHIARTPNNNTKQPGQISLKKKQSENQRGRFTQ